MTDDFDKQELAPALAESAPRSGYTRTGARRSGDDYQDIVALELVVDMLEHPDRYEWIEVEADETGYLDDVVAMRCDSSFVARQAKFATDPQNSWDWAQLLEKKERGTSRLQKWFNSFYKLKSVGTISEAALWTNRKAGDGIRVSLRHDGVIDFDKLDLTNKSDILNQLGPENEVRDFFAEFQFNFDRAGLDVLTTGVKRRFNRIGGDELGWLNLCQEMRKWVRERNEPSPDGKITLSVARRAALWNKLDRLPQGFEIPEDYVLPSDAFHTQFLSRIRRREQQCIVLTGPPGLGKSTYLSYLVEELKQRGIPTIRHHYFLSLRDKSGNNRFDHKRIVESLMGDLLAAYPDTLKSVAAINPKSNDFVSWIRATAESLYEKNVPLVIIIDGLDHVFREKNTIEELTEFFNLLLPPEDGVILIVGTQPVDDTQLPSRLLQQAPQSDWLQLPRLGRPAVKDWLAKHAEELQLSEDETAKELRLNECTHAFFDVSSGHPLVLKYSLRALVEQAQFVTETRIRSLPKCPSTDIEDYYRTLWRNLSERSRMILCLMTALSFPWSDVGLLSSLSTTFDERANFAEALKLVKHLLIRHALGWMPFHKSLYAFVESTEEFKIHSEELMQLALNWMKQSSSTEYIRWAFQWRLEAKLVNNSALQAGPTRQWAIEALSLRRDPADAIEIMVQAGLSALDSNDVVRYTAIGFLRDYFGVALEYQGDGWQELLEPQLELQEDPTLLARLSESVDRLNHKELLALGRKAYKVGDKSLLARVFGTLNDRISTTERQDELDSIQEATSRIVALYDGISTQRIIDYIAPLRKHRQNIEVFETICSECVRAKHIDRLIAFFDAREKLTDGEAFIVVRALSQCSIETGRPLEKEIGLGKFSDPLSFIACGLRDIHIQHDQPFPLPDSKVLDIPEYEHYRLKSAFQDYFYSIFFTFVGNYLNGHEQSNRVWLDEIGNYNWPRKLLHLLDRIARIVADKLVQREAIQFSYIFTEASSLPRPSWKEDRDSYYFFLSSGFALRRVALDLFRVQNSMSSRTISKEELEASVATAYCSATDFLETYVGFNREWLSLEATEWFLEKKTKELQTTVDLFPDRAITFVRLAKLAILHRKTNECRDLIRQASANLLSHGSHKDMILSGILECISACSNAKIAESESWLAESIPAILAVTEYTDGDETNHLINELSEVLWVIKPDWFLSHYQWLLNTEKYYRAQYAFHHFLENADLSNTLTKSIALTAIDEESLKILTRRAQADDLEAKDICRELDLYLGGITFDEDKRSASSGTRSVDDTQSTTPSKGPDPKDYPPARFDEYHQLCSSSAHYDREEPLLKWLEYWASTSQSKRALAKIQSVGMVGHYDHLPELIFEEALKHDGPNKAYSWLVHTFCNISGWQRYFVSENCVKKYWYIVRTKYPSKWMEFFRDTQLNDYTRSRIVSSADRFQRFVEYFIYMGQPQLAENVARTSVQFALSIVSSLKLEPPEWRQVHES